jgi:hypothetical protein
MLITSIEQIKDFMPVSSANDFNRLKPHLENAERDFLVPAISKNMYLELQEFADDLPEGTLSDVQESMKELLQLARISLVHLAYWIGYDTLNAYISDGGFRRLEGEKVKSLFKYQEDSLRDYLKVTGLNGLDAMLELMEDRPEHFMEFAASPEHDQLMKMFIPDTRTFHSLYFIGKSHLIFKRLVPYMQTVADLHIKPLMGDINYTYLVENMVADVIPDRVKDLIPEIRKTIVYFSTAMLMEDSGADLSDRGLYFEGKAATMTDNSVKTATEMERVDRLVKRNRGLGESYLSALKTFMITHAADWNGYTAPGGRVPNRDNKGKRSIWV